jgi:branched-chain amino acid transport system substrate-binding protein
LLAEGIRRAGSDDPGEVCAALSGIRDFAGVTGRIGFDENRNPRKQAVIMEIRRGVPWFYRIISPDHDQH